MSKKVGKRFMQIIAQKLISFTKLQFIKKNLKHFSRCLIFMLKNNFPSSVKKKIQSHAK